MRVIVPQITWHSRDPVLSVDCDPSCKSEDGFYRLATGGGDSQLLVWRVSAADTLKPDLKCVAELKRHEKPINVVRFSPDGNYIASGGDDAYVIIWKNEGKSATDESWLFEKSLRKHIEDVSDLSWSPDGNFLVSGSIDNSAVLWDVKKGTALHVWSEKEHTGFVHGVNYDPLHEVIATMCIDRNLRFFDIKTGKVANKALKFPDPWIGTEIQQSQVEVLDEKENIPKDETLNKDEIVIPKKKASSNLVNRLFQDESLPTFCRRLSFSPKGELLMVPGGMLPPSSNKSTENKKQANADDDLEKKGKDKRSKKKGTIEKPAANNNAVVLFCRHSWTNPCALIPTGTSYSIASRFCPVYFETARAPFAYDEDFANPKKNERSFACVGKLAHAKQEKESLMKMPYRLVYAVATNDSIIVGDTTSAEPLAVIRNVHFTRITDISWTANGRALMASSTDGYCSITTFGEGELGHPFCMDNFPALTKECFPILPPEPKVAKVVKKRAPKAKVIPVAKEGGKEIKKKDVKGRPVAAKKRAPQTKLSPVNSAVDVAIEKVEEEPLVSKDVILSTTPKQKPAQRVTLDRWFRKTTKTDETSVPTPEKTSTKIEGGVASQVTQKIINRSPVQSIASQMTQKIINRSPGPPEVIILDDDSNSNTEAPDKEAVMPRVYPMTPPVRPISSSKKPMSPIVTIVAGTSKAKKRPQEGVSPEELHMLTTAPIKCRRLMDQPVVILRSSDRVDCPGTTPNEPQTPSVPAEIMLNNPQVHESPKVTDPNCPRSPVSSASKPPRRIQLTTLGKSGPNAGNLD